ncbi:MAG TPA: hypothetical protein VFN68_04655, partial [Acidimicrobiales bacterium]|nr:hypothetical protein [Acidimicrobiales bacterium]
MQDNQHLDQLEQMLLTGRPVGQWTPRVQGTANAAGIQAWVFNNGLEVIAKPPNQRFGARQVFSERAAWLVLRTLGWADLASPVVIRSDNRGVPWSFNLKAAHPALVEHVLIPRMPETDVYRAGMFDLLVRNRDRLVRNWQILNVGENPRLFLFDHGYCFGLEPDRNPGS